MNASNRYPVGIQLLISDDAKTNPKCVYYTILLEAADPEELMTKAAASGRLLIGQVDQWPLASPEYMGIVDLYYAGKATTQKGTLFSRHTFSCKDRGDAQMGVHTLDVEFPLWTLSPFFLVESFHYFPHYPRDTEPRLRVAHTILSRFDLNKGVPLASEVEKLLRSPGFTRQVCMPFTPKKDQKPELLDWRLIATEDISQNPDAKFVYAAPWEFRNSAELERELMNTEEVIAGFEEVRTAWHEFEENNKSTRQPGSS